MPELEASAELPLLGVVHRIFPPLCASAVDEQQLAPRLEAKHADLTNPDHQTGTSANFQLPPNWWLGTVQRFGDLLAVCQQPSNWWFGFVAWIVGTGFPRPPA